MSSTSSNESISLPPTFIEAAFPFHAVFGRDLKLRQLGRSLCKLIPGAAVGARLDRVFKCRHAADMSFAALTSGPARLQILDSLDRPVSLRGQVMLLDEETAVFIGSPWFTSIDEVARCGLQISDFATHDPVVDLLQAVQHTQMTVAEIRDFAARLEQQNESLKAAHAQLKQQQSEARKLAMVASGTDNAVVLTNAQGETQWINKSFTRLTGYELHEIVGRKPGDLLQGPRSDPEVIARIARDLAEARSFVAELINYNKSGQEYWVRFEVQPIFEDGRLTGYMALETDITEARQHRERTDRLARLNDISREIIASFLEQDDLSASINLILGKIGRFLDVSRSYLFRYRDGQKWLFNTHEWCAENVACQKDQLQKLDSSSVLWWADTLKTSGIIRVDDVLSSQIPPEVRSILDPQEIRALLVMPLFIDGALEGFIGFDETRHPRRWLDEEVAILQTITESLSRSIERRVASRKLEATAAQLAAALKQAELASRYKSEFLANVSHEIRTPMTAISGYSEMILRSSDASDDLRDWARQIHRSGEHLLSILNDILDLSKIEAGKLALTREACSPVAVIEQVHSLMLPAAEEKNLEFITTYEGDQPRAIQTDAMRLRQILLNLVSNAIKFTDAGRVSLVARVEPGTADAPSTLKLAVRDTGIGIPSDRLRELFTPFAQLHTGESGRFGGTGLGLDICKRLAGLLGGTISVKSEVGLGSEFTLCLPLTGAELAFADAVDLRPVKASHPPIAPPALSGKDVMVVDDNLDNRRIIEFMLKGTGAVVHARVNGAEAIDLYDRFNSIGRRVDLVLMDMQMPVMDGYTATAHLRARDPNIPIIALTAAAMTGDEQKCLSAGCTAFVSKPIIPAELYRAITSIMETGPSSTTRAAELGADPEFRQLVASFVGRLPAVRAELVQSMRNDDFAHARMLVHRLAGTGTNFGFPQITQAAKACERALGGTMAQSCEGVEQVLAAIDNVIGSATRSS